MRKLLLLIVLSCCVGTASVASERHIRLAATEFPPYYGENLPDGGPISEIITQAYQQVGYTVEIHFYPWARALYMGQHGQIDGFSGVWHTSEREQWMFYSEPLPGNELVFYKRRGTEPQQFTSFDALQSYRIGYVRAYPLPPGFAEADLQCEEVTEDLQNLLKLERKRLDLILIDDSVAKHLIQQHFADRPEMFEALRPALLTTPMYLSIIKRMPRARQLVKDFNMGLRLLEEKGILKDILSKHGLL